jgi:hypothetical protein
MDVLGEGAPYQQGQGYAKAIQGSPAKSEGRTFFAVTHQFLLLWADCKFHVHQLRCCFLLMGGWQLLMNVCSII